MKDNTFEDYLHEKHSKQYVGTDDCMIDDFNDWRCALDPQEIIDYAEVYGEKRFNDGLGGHNYRMKDNQPNLSKCCNSPVQVEWEEFKKTLGLKMNPKVSGATNDVLEEAYKKGYSDDWNKKMLEK